VALVQAPAFLHRNPHLVELIEGDPQGADGTLEERREGEVEAVALRPEQAPAGARFLEAARRQVDIGPAGEAVFAVPVRFAVSQQHEFVHGAEL
jgi:hypothetical protein